MPADAPAVRGADSGTCSARSAAAAVAGRRRGPDRRHLRVPRGLPGPGEPVPGRGAGSCTSTSTPTRSPRTTRSTVGLVADPKLDPGRAGRPAGPAAHPARQDAAARRHSDRALHAAGGRGVRSPTTGPDRRRSWPNWPAGAGGPDGVRRGADRLAVRGDRYLPAPAARALLPDPGRLAGRRHPRRGRDQARPPGQDRWSASPATAAAMYTYQALWTAARYDVPAPSSWSATTTGTSCSTRTSSSTGRSATSPRTRTRARSTCPTPQIDFVGLARALGRGRHAGGQAGAGRPRPSSGCSPPDGPFLVDLLTDDTIRD